jgi:trk system potassium uptake protein TrkH
MSAMKRKLSDCSSCGKLMLLVGVLTAVPVFVLPFYPQEVGFAIAFLIPSVASILLGTVCCQFGTKDSAGEFEWRSTMQRSSLTVLFAWGWGIFVGALPFVLGGQISFLQAIFESVSGWTTTGLSVMDVSATPKIYLFHRSFMQFCGGLGFVMMMVMVVSGKQSMNLFNAEGHTDRLMPNLKRTAQTVFTMFSAFLLMGTIAYRVVGMPIFDGICHTMCALSTGGFSTKLASIGEYNSLAIEGVTIVLMLLGTTNFAVLLLLARRKWKQFFNVSEVRFMGGLLLICVPLTAASLANGLHISYLQGLRKAMFDIVSALSTTGYSTMSYTQWPAFAIGVLILMMLIGGGMGSTAGGMKLTRVYILVRVMALNFKKKLLSARTVGAPKYQKAQGKTPIDSMLIEDTTGFATCYLGIFVVGSLLLTLTANCSIVEAMFEFASALGTVGLSIGLTGPTTGSATLIVEIMGMIFGRLEIFVVLVGVYSACAKVKHLIFKV